MNLGSHNSWTFRRPKKWWMRLMAFTARCQSTTIQKQYNLGVRNFDLRIRLYDGFTHVTHGPIVYCRIDEVFDDLKFLNNRKDSSIRINLDIRSAGKLTSTQTEEFYSCCKCLQGCFPSIKFWSGDDLYTHTPQYQFDYYPSCEEHYASVSKPRIIDDWWPWLYAIRNNHTYRQRGTDKDFLILDYVNIK